MDENKDAQGEKKKLSLAPRGKLELKKTVEAGQVRQSFSHGRSKTVQVEVKRKRSFQPGQPGQAAPDPAARPAPEAAAPEVVEVTAPAAHHPAHILSKEESARRLKALHGAIKDEQARKIADAEEHRRQDEENRLRKVEDDRRGAEEARRKVEEEERRRQSQ